MYLIFLLSIYFDQDRTARIWKLPELTPGVVLRGHKRGIWSVEFSPVDQCVITASGDKTIKIWAISDGSCLKTFEGHTSSVFKVQFLTRGAQFVSCGKKAFFLCYLLRKCDHLLVFTLPLFRPNNIDNLICM